VFSDNPLPQKITCFGCISN